MYRLISLLSALLFLSAVQLFAQVDIIWQKEGIFEVRGIKFSPDGKTAYIGYDDQISAINAETGEHLFDFDNNGLKSIYTETMKVSSNGKYLYSSNTLFDVQLHKLIFHFDSLFSFEIINDSLAIGIHAKNGYGLSLFNLISHKKLLFVPLNNFATSSVLSPDKKLLALNIEHDKGWGEKYETIEIWDTENLAFIKEIARLDRWDSPKQIEFSNDSKILGFHKDYKTYIFDIQNNLMLFDEDYSRIFRFYKNNSIFFGTLNSNKTEFALGFKNSLVRLVFDSIPCFDLDVDIDNERILSYSDGILTYSKINDNLLSVIDNNPKPFVEYHDRILFVQFKDSINTIKLYDIEGKLLHTSNPYDKNFELGINLASGVYIVEVSNGNGRFSNILQVMR